MRASIFCVFATAYFFTPALGQQEGLPLKIGRMSKEAAEGHVNLAKVRVGQLYDGQLRDVAEARNTVESLLLVLKECDDGEMRYRCHYLLGKLAWLTERDFARRLGKTFPPPEPVAESIANILNVQDLPTSFAKAFGYFEKCILEYPDEEKQRGLAAKSVPEMLTRVAQEKRFISASLCVALFAALPYPKEHGAEMEQSANVIISTFEQLLATNISAETSLTGLVAGMSELEGIAPTAIQIEGQDLEGRT